MYSKRNDVQYRFVVLNSKNTLNYKLIALNSQTCQVSRIGEIMLNYRMLWTGKCSRLKFLSRVLYIFKVSFHNLRGNIENDDKHVRTDDVVTKTPVRKSHFGKSIVCASQDNYILLVNLFEATDRNISRKNSRTLLTTLLYSFCAIIYKIKSIYLPVSFCRMSFCCL